MPQAIKAVDAAAAVNKVSMFFVRGSDHHLYIDTPDEFDVYVAKALA